MQMVHGVAKSRIQLSNFTFIFCFIDSVDHNKLWKILKEMGIPDHLTCLLRNLYQVKKQQLELDMEQRTCSKLGKECVRAIYCHPVYLTYMQGSSSSSVNQSCLTLCDPMNCSTPGLPVHHQLPESTQTHVH